MVGTANVEIPLSAAKMFGATALPVYNRLANSGTPSTAPNLTITELQVLSMDWALSPDMSQIAGSLSLSAARAAFQTTHTLGWFGRCDTAHTCRHGSKDRTWRTDPRTKQSKENMPGS